MNLPNILAIFRMVLAPLLFFLLIHKFDDDYEYDDDNNDDDFYEMEIKNEQNP